VFTPCQPYGEWTCPSRTACGCSLGDLLELSGSHACLKRADQLSRKPRSPREHIIPAEQQVTPSRARASVSEPRRQSRDFAVHNLPLFWLSSIHWYHSIVSAPLVGVEGRIVLALPGPIRCGFLLVVQL
jgi:hypothetical protein